MRLSKRSFSIFITAIAIILLFLIYLVFNPVLLDFSRETENNFRSASNAGDTIHIFQRLDFEIGDWEAYIVISQNDDMDVSNKIPKGRLLRTDDRALLLQMKNKLVFVYTGADISTVDNEFIVCQNGHVVFRSAILIDKTQEGLQNREYGFLEAKPLGQLSGYCKDFKRVYSPFVVLK